MTPQIIINGLVVEIQSDQVKIFDIAGDLSKKEALLMIKYLHTEGFILGERVVLEIITDENI